MRFWQENQIRSIKICKYLNTNGSCECQIDLRKFERASLTPNENVADNGLESRGGPPLPRREILRFGLKQEARLLYDLLLGGVRTASCNIKGRLNL